MAVKVRVPAPMQKLTQEKREVEIGGATVAELIANMEKQYPGVRNMVCDDGGKVRRPTARLTIASSMILFRVLFLAYSER